MLPRPPPIERLEDYPSTGGRVMSRHFWRACNRAAGFSFVELLVTILIAGIAFAAMVPVFVGAQQVSSGEQMRNVSLQLAQDKLEKVRGLDYDLITQANLQTPASRTASSARLSRGLRAAGPARSRWRTRST